MITASTDKENMVVMHNDLIKGKSDLGLNETKLLRIAIMQVMKEDMDFKTFEIGITDLAKMIGIPSSNIYRDIDEITTNLMSHVISVNNGSHKKWKKFHWVDTCECDNGTITMKLHSDLKPYLINLSSLYTQYILEDVLKLKTVYSIRIYELLREAMKNQKVYSGSKVTVFLSVDTIRKATNTEDTYKQSGSFKIKLVLNPLKEINDKLGYNIVCKDVKRGRTIIGYNFTIGSKWDD